LLKSIRLKWLAQSLGFEKIVVKKGKMLAYFISNPDSLYYQSEVFQHILQYIQASHCCTFREKKMQNTERIYLPFTKELIQWIKLWRS